MVAKPKVRRTRKTFNPDNLYSAAIEHLGFAVVAFNPALSIMKYHKGMTLWSVWGVMVDHNYSVAGRGTRAQWAKLINLIDHLWPGVLNDERRAVKGHRFFLIERSK